MAAKHRVLVTTAILTITAALGTGGVAALRWVEAQKADQRATEPPEPGVDVEVAVAAYRAVSHRVAARGFVAPDEELTIASEVPGRIDGQYVEASDHVAKGDALFQIDRALHETAVQKAEAEIARTGADLHEAQVQAQRVEHLQKSDSAPPIEVLEVQTAVERAEAMAREAEVTLAEARLLLEKTTIRAPVDGIVARVHAREGEFALTGQPLAELIVTARVKLTVQLNDQEVVTLSPGDPVTVSVPALPGERFLGSVLRIFPRAALDSRKFEIEIEIPNPDGRLRPGFFAEALITPENGPSDEGDGGGEVLAIPRLAVMQLHRQEYCFIVHRRPGENLDRARWTLIETLPILTDPQNVQVISGLRPGDRVITSGLPHVSHDTVVRVVD